MPQQAPSVAEAKKDENKVPEVKYTPAERYYRDQTIRLLSNMQAEKEQKRPQFNDMTWNQWDDKMIKADISYIPPAKNKGDTRIVTGMTRKKDSTLLSTALSYDFEPNCTAYNEKDLIINHIGEEAEDMVRKSRQMEMYDSKRPLLYRGIISRGTYYTLELFVEKYGYEKELPKGYVKGNLNVTWAERIKKVYEGCEVNGLDPKKVFFTNYKEFFIQNQDAVAIVERISYEEAREVHQEWERWEYVPKRLRSVGITSNETMNSSVWSPYWTMTEIEEGEVERIFVMKKKTNEMQIYLNGVQMLPVVNLGTDKRGRPIVSGFPLTCISPSGDYPIVKGDYEPVDGFAISKGQPANMYVDQEVQDEFLKLMILKTKQSFWPPMANNSGRVLSRQNFLPSVINDDIRKDTVYPMIESDGVTAGEFSFYQLLKGIMEDKSVSKQYEGSNTENMTATQVLENKKQQLLALGLALDGFVRFERDLAVLRWHNILAHWTQAQDVNIDKARGSVSEVYRTMTVEKNAKGAKIRKVIKFTKDVGAMQAQDKEGFGIHSAEEKYKKETGVDVRYSFINPEVLRNLKATWYWSVVPNDKKDDTLSRMIFVQNIQEAINLFGPQSLKVDSLKQRFSIVIGENFDDWFRTEQEVASEMLKQQSMMGETPQPGAMKSPVPKPNMRQAMGQGR